MNLCINARDAMQGAGTLRIGVRPVDALQTHLCLLPQAGAEHGMVEVAVRDTGIGHSLPRCWSACSSRSSPPRRSGKGSGMGLATVHGIVHEYGGHIVVDTAPGQGTTFRILFSPLADGQGPRVERERKQPVRTQQARLAGRVLVVDDEEMVGQFMKELLESWGLEVVVKTNALDAQMAFEVASRSFDLVVTDQTMPRMTGVELTRQLLTVRPDLAVVLYTGFSDAPTSEEIKRCGVSAVVAKPVEPDTLFSVLSAHLLRTARVAGS